jgi:hypothetical protein
MTPTADSLQGFRNRIINGDMRIAQRGTAAVTGNVTFPVDRWQITNSSNASISAQQDSDVPAGQGFSFSAKYTVTTADASVTGTEDALFRQLIEGFNTSDLAWGTASAKTVTLSFWVRSSVTGTFGGALKNSGNTRSYPFTYAISSANTWEKKSITIAGETSGTWVADNGIGVRVVFSLGSGSDRVGTANAWGSANYDGATGQTQLISTLNATWYITGVQLEVGSVATPFERRDYGRELIMCQRYCEIGRSPYFFANSLSNTSFYLFNTFKVTKRASATVTTTSQWRYWSGGSAVNYTPTLNGDVDMFLVLGSGLTAAQGLVDGNWIATAEL